MIMDPGLNHAAAVLPGEMHGNGGDIDSLLSGGDTSDGHVGSNSGHGGASHGTGLDGKARRLLEPYERHRAHDLRAECYRRGIRPIKKGPNANDNKNGYIVLLRKYDGTSNGLDDRGANGGAGVGVGGAGNHPHPHSEEDGDDGDSDSTPMAAALAIKKRKLPTGQLAITNASGTTTGTGALTSAAVVAANDLAGFYDTSQAPLVPVLPMQYPALAKPTQVQAQAPPTANPTTSDLEILSGIANSYTMQMGAALTTTSSSTASTAHSSVAVATANGVLSPHVSADLCGACRSVVSDQLMESIRLGRNKMQMLEYQRLLELRDKDTMHLKEIVGVLRDLRQSLRDAQKENRLTHELLVELEDDIAFFQALKERTKERMRREMQEARERAAKQNSTNPGGGTT